MHMIEREMRTYDSLIHNGFFVWATPFIEPEKSCRLVLFLAHYRATKTKTNDNKKGARTTTGDTPCLNRSIGSTQWTNASEFKILIYIIKIIKNAILPNLLAYPIHMIANQHQFLDDIFIFVSSKNWCLLAISKWLCACKKI